MIEINKKVYLFGASEYCDNVISSEVLSNSNIVGIFDNDEFKWGKEKAGIDIIQPQYIADDVDIMITMSSKYHMEAINQLIKLGYYRFYIVKKIENQYKLVLYDYNKYKNQKGRIKIILYIENNSFSNVQAINYFLMKYSKDKNLFDVFVMQSNLKESDMYFYLLNCDVVVTDTRWNYFSMKGNKPLVIQLWHGFPIKTMANMSRSEDIEEKEKNIALWSNYNIIASYGTNYTTFISACYGNIVEQFEVTGMPRNDLLLLSNGRTNLAELFPFSINKTIIFYMPTFRQTKNGAKNGEKSGYIFNWDEFEFDNFEEYCRRKNIFFIIKIHPADYDYLHKIIGISEYITILVDDMFGDKCLYEYLNAADILITDYSSVYYDYLLLNRPIIFADKDSQEYEKDRGFLLAPVNFWRPGAVVRTMQECMDEIDSILTGKDKYKVQRNLITSLVHEYRDANSSQRVIDKIVERLEKRKNKCQENQ